MLLLLKWLYFLPSVPSQAFGQRQPPLYVAIQKILDKYPDGQIFKVQLYCIINTQMVAVALGPWASHSEDRAEP